MRECAVCGAAIPETRRSNHTKYCSLKCAREAEKRQSIDRIAKKALSHNAIALYVYTAYKSECALCGWKATESIIRVNGKLQYARGNEVHHITPAREGGSDEWENVILLCPNHHKQADMGLLSRDYLREHTRPYRMNEEQEAEAKARVADAVAAAIFGGA